jgi:hypothetical protein
VLFVICNKDSYVVQVISFLLGMKTALQFVCVAVIGLLAVVPGLEGLLCASAMGFADSNCPMSMRGMSADCPMAEQVSATDCSENCRAHATPATVLQWSRPEKPKRLSLEGGVVAGISVAKTSPERTVHGRSSATAPSPPRYILLRVIRI